MCRHGIPSIWGVCVGNDAPVLYLACLVKREVAKPYAELDIAAMVLRTNAAKLYNLDLRR